MMASLYHASQNMSMRLGPWLRQLRMRREARLREVAAEIEMDQSHLGAIERGQRLPTEEQTAKLARFFRIEETEIQARRCVEKFRQEVPDHAVARKTVSLLAEEAGIYNAGSRNNPRRH